MTATLFGPRERPEKPDRREERDDHAETPARRGWEESGEAYPAILPPEPWPDPDDKKDKDG